jgi:hypothetical protein
VYSVCSFAETAERLGIIGDLDQDIDIHIWIVITNRGDPEVLAAINKALNVLEERM